MNLCLGEVNMKLLELAMAGWDTFCLLVLRPFLATVFVLTVIGLGWVVAWKVLLVRVPVIQEIFGLKKNSPKKTKPVTRRLSEYYSKRHSASGKYS
ncbi:uncharacterized protein LOC105421789 [Amborella trichopoda]|uniref:uncharacterized protein LOC105421789 n=1 Tax=Amborella trichopoda TaxID=13333 RepID=UPI0005D3FC9E|nr:uncharacterized protein LOC105421789 [Amborella trichopoda]|eukprot:XP_011628875.1 uncharacterized protein LOC105421789 [Amborella trichopoda]